MSDLPVYKCHKEVRACKIGAIGQRIVAGKGVVTEITPADGFESFEVVAADYMTKHQPEAGGYYVRYADGYESYSPAKAFEEGYTLLSGAPLDEETPVEGEEESPVEGEEESPLQDVSFIEAPPGPPRYQGGDEEVKS